MIAALVPFIAALVVLAVAVGVHALGALERVDMQAAADRAEQQQWQRFEKAMRP